jgi:hypothetical protein
MENFTSLENIYYSQFTLIHLRFEHSCNHAIMHSRIHAL